MFELQRGKLRKNENYIKDTKTTMYEKCLGLFLTIFGRMKAINPLYPLTGFLTLRPYILKESKTMRERNFDNNSNMFPDFHF